MKKHITTKKIALTLLIVITDLVVYLFLCVMLMSYDDIYSEDNGEYGRWASMNQFQKLITIGLYFWWFINAVLLFYISLRLFKWIRF